MSDKASSGIARLMAEAMAKKAAKVEPSPVAIQPKSEPVAIETSVVPASNPFVFYDNDGEASERSEQAEPQLKGEPALYSAEQLARIDTDTEELEPKARQGKADLVKAAELAKDMVLKDSSSVRQLCDEIDTLIESHDQLVGPGLVTLRGYVQTLMVTLKARPEFDEIIIDKDVRNVMRFIRTVREQALATREVKVIKKAVRETKKKGDTKLESAFSNAFANMMKVQLKS